MKARLPAIVLALLAAVPAISLVPGVNANYWLHNLILVVMWSVIGMSWNLLSGYCGQVSFGHAAFFGIGAYTSGLLYTKLGVSAWWGILATIPVLAVAGLIIGFICLRLRGPFFALATIAVGVILRVVAENLVDFTGGDLGIMIRERTWVEKTWYYYIILALAAGTFWFVERVVSSRLGYYFVAIREDQDAAESLGIDTTLYKTIALVLSAVLAGFAGAFYTNYMGYIDPKVVFALHDISIVAIMVVMVGGVATRWGPIVGAVIMILLAELIRTIPQIGAAHHTVFGVLLIVVIIFLPNGVVGDAAKLRRWLRLGRTS
ncbi:MAG: branched-chain amino acid ABC transporter permease [Candidatus Methylomirabilia bacterium]